MARERADARMLNRMRLKSGGPIVPFRVLLCPLREEGSTVGLLAAIRTRQQPPFETADLGVLSEAAPALQEQLRAGAQSQTRIARWSVLDLEVAQRFRDGEPACVVFADLDHMHAINEVAGLWPATAYCGRSAACGSRGCCPRAASPVTSVGIASSPYCSVTRSTRRAPGAIGFARRSRP